MYDVIVIGAGGVGASAIWHLSERKANVLGIDQFRPPHHQGSSHGQSRLIRKAYFEHPDYVPLVLRAYENWRRLESLTGRSLLHETGLIEIGPRDGIVVAGARESGRRHGLPVEDVSPAEIMRRFSGLRVPDEMDAVFEPGAGYLEVENCVEAFLQLARRNGATLSLDEAVCEWEADGNGYVVRTLHREYRGARIVLAGGAWSGTWLSNLGVKLTVLRKTLHWFAVPPSTYLASDGFPAFLVEDGARVFYGFPVVDERGLKAAEHTGGDVVSHPSSLDRSERQEDSSEVARFLGTWLPLATDRRTHFEPCLYTMSPDGNFILDRHPVYPGVVLAAGLSGHGFKFTSVIGEILADLALVGQTTLPIEFLSARRFQTRG